MLVEETKRLEKNKKKRGGKREMFIKVRNGVGGLVREKGILKKL